MPEQPEQPEQPQQHRFRIDWIRTIAGALAAVSSAVLLSTLGAAGTVIGAAVGSVVVSIATSLYSQGISRSREQIADAQAAALRKVGVAQAEVRRAQRRQQRHDDTAAEAHLQYADRQLVEARTELVDSETEPPRWTDRLRGLPWKRVGLLAAGFFVAAAVLITGFELISGRPVSSYTGGSSGEHGTSWTHLGGGGAKPAPKPTPQQPTPSTGPTATTSTQPSPTPTPTPTEQPSGSSSPAPTPTASPTSGSTGLGGLVGGG